MKNWKYFWIGIFGVAVLVLFFAMVSIPAADVSADSHGGSEGDPVEMIGHSFFNGEIVESGYVISDEAFNQCEARATLIPVEGQQYELRVGEICGFGPRLSIWDLTIAEDGTVGGVMQAEVVYPPQDTGSVMGELWLRTGCMMVGDFPALSGTWDGEHLRTYTSFQGRCHGGDMWGEGEIMGFISGDTDPESPIADGLTWDDGPARMEFGVDLMVESATME